MSKRNIDFFKEALLVVSRLSGVQALKRILRSRTHYFCIYPIKALVKQGILHCPVGLALVNDCSTQIHCLASKQPREFFCSFACCAQIEHWLGQKGCGFVPINRSHY